MLDKAFGGIAGIAIAGAIGFVVAAFTVAAGTEHGDTTRLWLGAIACAAVGILAAVGWAGTRQENAANPPPARNVTANEGSNANAGDAAMINQVVGGQGHNFGTVNNYAAPSPSVAVPVLEFGDPMFDDQVGILDAEGNVHTGVRMWRVELRNIAEGTEARDVEVQIARSVPAVKTFPVDLHRFHDDNAPCTQRHNVRHNAPITFDVIAKDHSDEVYFLWRSDLPRHQYTYIYQLSDAERRALLGRIREQGAILILRAAGNAPVATKEKAYRVFIDERGRFMMETVQPEVG